MFDVLFRNIALLPMFASCIITFISVPAVIEIAKYFNLLDDPAKRPHPAHTESRIIPRAGGLAVFGGILVSVFVFIPITKEVMGILLGGAIIIIVGLLDDFKDVHPYLRLGVNFVAANLAVVAGAGIDFITNPLTSGILHLTFNLDLFGQIINLPIAHFLAVFWIMWSINMVQFSGGVDGQLPGFVTIAAIVIGILSFNQLVIENFPSWVGTTLTFITAGAYLGFLPWNFYPQKIIPGYSGKALAGYLLATLAILNSAKFGTMLLVLALPAIDFVYVVASRIMTGKNPTMGSDTHLHHRLLRAGWSKRQVALFYWIVSAILGTVALSINAKQKFFAILAVAIALAGLILWLKLFTTSLKRSDPDNGQKI